MRSAARAVVRELSAHGYQAFWVGGCVRDQRLGRVPTDYDIVTDARPEQVMGLFEDTKPVGQVFGVVLVRMHGHMFEVATFREDGPSADQRRPDSVRFATMEEDARRRDFTINALYYDPLKEAYFDPVGGMADLRRGVLRFIGEPAERVQEDALRLLRAVRFAAHFELTYDPKTAEALAQHASLLAMLSAERVFEEIRKMLLSDHSERAFRNLHQFTLLERIMPEMSACAVIPQPVDHHAEGTVLEHLFLTLGALRPGASLPLRFAAVLHDIGKATTVTKKDGRWRYPDHAAEGEQFVKAIARRLRFPRGLKSSVSWLVRHHHIFDDWDQMRRSRQLQYFDHDLFDDLLELHRADVLGAKPESFTGFRRTRLAWLDELWAEYYSLRAQGGLPKDQLPLLTGDDLQTLFGVKPGPKVGALLQKLREAQLEKRVNTQEQAEEYLKKYL